MLIYKNYDASKAQLHRSMIYLTYGCSLLLIFILLFLIYIGYDIDLSLFSLFVLIPYVILLHLRINSIHLFEIHNDYILTKNYLQLNWKKTSINKSSYNEYYEKEDDYLDFHVGSSKLKLNTNDSSNHKTIDAIKLNIQHDSYYIKTWKNYLKGGLLVIPFLIWLFGNYKIEYYKSTLENNSIENVGHISIKDKVNKIEYLGKNSTVRIELKNHQSLLFETDKDSIEFHHVNTFDSVELYISPYEYERKIVKSVPLKWYDKFFRYKYISIIKLNKL